MTDVDKNGNPMDWKKTAIRMWPEFSVLVFDLRELDKKMKDGHGVKYKNAMSRQINYHRKGLREYFKDNQEELLEGWTLEDFDD